MSSLVVAVSLGLLYCLVSLYVVGRYRQSKFVDLSFFAFVAISANLVSVVTSQNSSIVLFAAGVIGSVLFLSAMSFLINLAVFEPISRLNETKKTISGVGVFLFLITFLDVVSPAGKRLNSPFHEMSITTPSMSTGIFVILFSAIILAGIYTFLYRTVLGAKLRADSLDSRTSRGCGISDFSNKIKVSLITGIMATFSGVGFALVNSEKSLSASVLPFATAAIAIVVVARARDFRLCIVGSFIISSLQIVAYKNLDSISSGLQSLSSLVGIKTVIVENQNFAFWFLPFVLSLLVLNVLPAKWIKDVQND